MASSGVVWYLCDGAQTQEWSICQLVGRNANGSATLKIKKSNVDVDPEAAKNIRPKPGEVRQNLAKVRGDGFGAASAEEEIRNNFCASLPYTEADDVSVCVSPCRPMDIYGEDYMDKYSALDPALPPHIFNVGAKAYAQLMNKKQSQTIILLGEPASGKTQAFGHVTQFLVQTAGEGDDVLKNFQKLLGPLISTRCRASKEKSWSSTRAILMFDLSIGTDGFIAQTAASVQMLEAGRLSSHYTGNHDCGLFEALLFAMKSPVAKEYLGEKPLLRLLGEDAEVILEEFDPEKKDYHDWVAALKSFGISLEEVLRILCGIVLLADIEFKEEANHLQFLPAEVVSQAAKALGVSESSLTSAIGKATSGVFGGKIAIAQSSMTGILEDLYRGLVGTILKACNAKLKQGVSSGQSIKIVEFPSFQDNDKSDHHEVCALQWLCETVHANLLNVQRFGRDPVEDLTERQERAMIACEALEHLSETAEKDGKAIAGTVSTLPTDRTSSEARHQQYKASVTQLTSASKLKRSTTVQQVVRLEIDRVLCEGAVVSATHDIDAPFVRGARGNTMSASFIELIGHSSLRLLTELSQLPGVACGHAAAAAAVRFARQSLRGESGAQPWLVCCMRPNEKLLPTVLSKPVLLRQVKTWRIAEAVQIGPPERYSIIWPLALFRKQFQTLLSSSTQQASDAEACRLLVSGMGGGKGTVGSDYVFGSELLQKLLESKVKDKESGKSIEDERDDKIDQKIKQTLADVKNSLSKDEEEQKRKEAKLQEDARKMQEDNKKMQDELAKVKEEQQSVRQSIEQKKQQKAETDTQKEDQGESKRLAEELAALKAVQEQRQRQMNDLTAAMAQQQDDFKKKQREYQAELEARKVSEQDSFQKLQQEVQFNLSQQQRDFSLLQEQLKRDMAESLQTDLGDLKMKQEQELILLQQRQAMESKRFSQAARKKSMKPDGGASDRGSLAAVLAKRSSMAAVFSKKDGNASLLVALTQMAAVLRVAKDREVKHNIGVGESPEDRVTMRRELDMWRAESAQLWQQVKRLQEENERAQLLLQQKDEKLASVWNAKDGANSSRSKSPAGSKTSRSLTPAGSRAATPPRTPA